MPWIYVEPNIRGSVTDDDGDEIGVLSSVELEQTQDVRYFDPSPFDPNPAPMRQLARIGVAQGSLKLEIFVTNMQGMYEVLRGMKV